MSAAYQPTAAPATDAEKLEWLYNTYKQPMYHAALQILRHPYDAFVKVMGHLDKLRPEDESKTRCFLVVAAENATIDHYRRKNRWGAAPTGRSPMCCASPFPMYASGSAVPSCACAACCRIYKPISRQKGLKIPKFCAIIERCAGHSHDGSFYYG